MNGIFVNNLVKLRFKTICIKKNSYCRHLHGILHLKRINLETRFDFGWDCDILMTKVKMKKKLTNNQYSSEKDYDIYS